MDDNLTLTENEEDLYKDIDMCISLVIADSEISCSVSSTPLVVPHTMTFSLNLEILPITQIATQMLSASHSDFIATLQKVKNKLCGKMIAAKSSYG